MPLTQFAIIDAKPAEKNYKLSYGAGLQLLVQRNGSKLWRFRYQFCSRENMLTFGPFPATSLASARTKRDEARALLASGTDPSTKRKLDKIAAAGGFIPDVIEAALAHIDDNEIRRAYNRATYLAERTRLMRDWADLLDTFREQSVRPRRAA